MSRLSVLPLLLLAFTPGAARAQTGSVEGVVEDSLGRQLASMQVTVLGTNRTMTTDSRGAFHFEALRPAPYTISVRGLGYAPVVAEIVVIPGEKISLWIELRAAAVTIEPVVVSAPFTSSKLSAAGFERRRSGSTVPVAQYVTRADIEKHRPFAMSHLLLRMNSQTRACVEATIFLDGTLQAPAPRDAATAVLTAREAAKIGVSAPRPNPLDQFPPEWIEGMEVYVGLAQIPAEFKAPGRTARCVIVLWTR